MNSTNKKMGYSCLTFLSFAASFLILCVINIFLPISDFKMMILSVVSVLLSVQQLLEAYEEVENKITELEEKVARQENQIYAVDGTFTPPDPQHNNENHLRFKSQWFFVTAMVILIVGLVIDIDFHSAVLTNTTTIFSFSVIFFTMAYKERFAGRIDKLNKELYETDQRIIAEQCKLINEVKNHVQLQIPTLRS